MFNKTDNRSILPFGNALRNKPANDLSIKASKALPLYLHLPLSLCKKHFLDGLKNVLRQDMKKMYKGPEYVSSFYLLHYSVIRRIHPSISMAKASSVRKNS
jgi:hypothetical protein